MTSGMSGLPKRVVGDEKIPCKSWDAISKDWSIGEAEGRKPFLGFMLIDMKVCSVRFDVRNKDVDVSVNRVDDLDQIDVLKVFHCDGLLLCLTEDMSSLVVWNPYLGQTRSILPKTSSFHRLDNYALGYDINNNHKILRFIDDRTLGPHMFESEIYDLRSDSWRVLELATPDDLHIDFYQRSVSLKGVSYFYSKVVQDSSVQPLGRGSYMVEQKVIGDYLRSFDFTTEKFGERMLLPFKSTYSDTVTLSCVRQEQLAILHYRLHSPNTLEFWVTTEIKPNSSSWSKFLKVDITALKRTRFTLGMKDGGSFFIDQEEKVAVVFGTNIDQVRTGYRTPRYNTAFVLGEDGFSESTCLGKRDRSGTTPLVCSSAYTPSLVQVRSQ